MTLDEQKIEMISTKDDTVYLTMVEHRPWTAIEDAKNKLLLKIANFRRYVITDEFKNKFKGKRIVIRLHTAHKPPEEIKEILKKENVKYELI